MIKNLLALVLGALLLIGIIFHLAAVDEALKFLQLALQERNFALVSLCFVVFASDKLLHQELLVFQLIFKAVDFLKTLIQLLDFF